MVSVPVILTAVAVGSTVVLAGCSGFYQYVPDWLTPKSSPPVVLNFESDPPGADVRTAQGQTCQTPCSLSVPPENQAVNFAKLGYLPQTVQVAIRTPEHSMFESPTVEVQPNPVAVVLQVGAPDAAQAEAEIAPARHRDAGGGRATAPGIGFPAASPAALTAVPAGTAGPSWTIGGLFGTIVHYLNTG